MYNYNVRSSLHHSFLLKNELEKLKLLATIKWVKVPGTFSHSVESSTDRSLVLITSVVQTENCYKLQSSDLKVNRKLREQWNINKSHDLIKLKVTYNGLGHLPGNELQAEKRIINSNICIFILNDTWMSHSRIGQRTRSTIVHVFISQIFFYSFYLTRANSGRAISMIQSDSNVVPGDFLRVH